MIYFTADLHLGHNGILKHTDRPFKDVKEMNKVLIDNINSFVSDNDTLYILGDLCHKVTIQEANEMISKIKGKKYLIRGNHDKQYDESLFIRIADYLEINIDEKDFILMHYPLRSWNRMRRGAIQLHGHIHAPKKYNLDNRDSGILQYDVGVDANDYYPVSAKDIIKFYEGIIPSVNDHHYSEEE